MTKWGGGSNQRIVFSLPDSLLLSPTFFRLQCPLPRLRAGPESLPGLRSGYSDTPTPKSQPRTKKPRDPRRAHSPCRRRASTSPRRHGPVRTGRGGGLRTCLQRSGTRRLSGAPGPASDPSPPATASRLGLTARASSRSLYAHPPAGAQRRPLKPCPSAGTAASTAEAEANPLFLFLSFRRPQGGGARDSPRRDPKLPQKTLKKSPAFMLLSPAGLVPSSPRLCFVEPPSWSQGGGWTLGVGVLRLIRRREGKGVIGLRGGRRWFLVALHLLKVPICFVFCFEKSAQSSQLSDWILVERSEC